MDQPGAPLPDPGAREAAEEHRQQRARILAEIEHNLFNAWWRISPGAHGTTFGLGRGLLAGGVPRFAEDLIEGFGGPLHNMDRIARPHRVRTPLGHDGSDEVRPIGRDMRDLSAALFAEEIEEAPRTVVLLRPGAAQTGRRASWSTTTIKYLCPRL